MSKNVKNATFVMVLALASTIILMAAIKVLAAEKPVAVTITPNKAQCLAQSTRGIDLVKSPALPTLDEQEHAKAVPSITEAKGTIEIITGTPLTPAERARMWPPSPQYTVIATCDPHRAYDSHQVAKVAVKGLGPIIQAVQKQAQAKADAVTLKEGELVRAKGKKKTEKIEAELIDLKANLQSFMTVANAQIAERRRKIARDGYTDIYKAIAAVAEKRGIALVLSKDHPKLEGGTTQQLLNNLYYRHQVLYADDSLDITDEVIEEMNKGGEDE